MLYVNSKSIPARQTEVHRAAIRPTILWGIALLIMIIACVTLGISISQTAALKAVAESERNAANAALESLQATLKSTRAESDAASLAQREKVAQSDTRIAQLVGLADQASSRAAVSQTQMDQLTTRATLLQQKNDQSEAKLVQAALQLQEAQENAKRVAAEIVQMSNRSHRVREFMEGAFHSFAPATVGPSDATVNGVMKDALNELKNGGLDDDLDAKSQLESTIATILMDGGEFSQAKPILDQVLQYRRSILYAVRPA